MKKKKLLSLVIMSGYLIWNAWTVFAFWGFSELFNTVDTSRSTNVKSLSIDNVKSMITKRSGWLSTQIENLDSRIKRTTNITKKKYLTKILKLKKKIKNESKSRRTLQEVLDKSSPSLTNLKISSVVASSPIDIEWWSTIVDNNLKNLSTHVSVWLQPTIVEKLWGNTSLDTFSLNTKFNPNKVVTFDNIRLLYIWNLNQDQQLLNCDNPDDAVIWLCSNISNLLSDLTAPDKKLTINDVYKLQVYSNVISKAIYYEGTLKHYKKWALVLWIDPENNTVNSIDIVRSYTSYITWDNNVLPFVAKRVDINVTRNVPRISGTDPVIVLWLNHGKVIWINVYPLVHNVSIPGATAYKIMKLEGFKSACKNRYTSSLWFGDGKFGISKYGLNLRPANTQWIEFNLQDECYTVFK